MSTEENKTLARHFMEEVLNKHNVAILDQFMAENIQDHDQFPGLPQGIEGQRQVLTMMFNGFPDQKYTIDALIAEGDKVVIRSTLRGTHKGAFIGVAPTGKHVEIAGTDIVRIENGKWVEHWGVFDALGMMQQIGAIPATSGR
jgi:steroid delta-isomerase-like uncharacterized protein